MGYIKLLGGFVMLMIFSLAIVSYVMFYTDDNNSFVTLDDDFKTFNRTIIGNATLYSNTAGNSSDNVFRSTVAEGSQTTVTGEGLKGGIFSLYKTTESIFDLVSSKIFGGNPIFRIFISVITTFIVFVMAVYFIKMWIGANPD